jgi:hypothetical protein
MLVILVWLALAVCGAGRTLHGQSEEPAAAAAALGATPMTLPQVKHTHELQVRLAFI